MSKTQIEWTQRPGTIGETWNPTTGCNKVDRGCKNCYAEIMHRRLQAMGQEKYGQDFLKGAVPHEDTLNIPMRWTKPRTVFVNSMSDLFHVNVPFDFILRVFQVMKSTPQHTYLILTKRPERAVTFWRRLTGMGWTCQPNVWMGTSANDQKSADIRIPELLELTDCLKFLSYEPATGGLDLMSITHGRLKIDCLAGEIVKDGTILKAPERKLDWVIAGGESGPKADPANPEWFRLVRDDCKKAGVPFFLKQWGLWQPEHPGHTARPGVRGEWMSDGWGGGTLLFKSKDKSYNVLDGTTHQEFPEPIKQPA